MTNLQTVVRIILYASKLTIFTCCSKSYTTKACRTLRGGERGEGGGREGGRERAQILLKIVITYS